MLSAIRAAPKASVSSPGYLTILREKVRSFGRPRMTLVNVSYRDDKGRAKAITNLKNLPDEKRAYARKSSQGGVDWDTPEQENGGGCHCHTSSAE